MGKIESTETGLETQDSAADQISEMLERFKNRLTLDNPRLMRPTPKRKSIPIPRRSMTMRCRGERPGRSCRYSATDSGPTS